MGTTPVRLAALEAVVLDLSEQMGAVRAILGTSPDPATGHEGSGLCRVLSEIASERDQTRRRLLRVGTYAGAGGASVALFVELGLRLVHLLGG